MSGYIIVNFGLLVDNSAEESGVVRVDILLLCLYYEQKGSHGVYL